MYHCDDDCIPIRRDPSCGLETFSNSTGIFQQCEPMFRDNCITDLKDCVNETQSNGPGVFLITHCFYQVSESFLNSLPQHIQCEGKNNWLQNCDGGLLVLLSQRVVYSTTQNQSEYNLLLHVAMAHAVSVH